MWLVGEPCLAKSFGVFQGSLLFKTHTVSTTHVNYNSTRVIILPHQNNPKLKQGSEYLNMTLLDTKKHKYIMKLT